MTITALFLAASAALTLPVGGEGWRKVDVTLEARALDASRTFEANPELEIMQGDRVMPSFVLIAQGADGKRVGRSGSFRNIVWSGEWRPYVRRLWVPPLAKELRLDPGKSCAVRNVRVAASAEKGIAVNGDFALGPFNYSGIAGCDRHLCIERGADGRGLFNTCPDGAASTEAMPVRPGKHRIGVRWSNPTKKSLRVHVCFYDAKGAKAGDFVWKPRKAALKKGEKAPEWTENAYDFGVPAGVDSLTATFYEGCVESYSVVRTED